MRILQINDYGLYRGGTEKYLLTLKEGLKSERHEVALVTSDYLKEKEGFFADYTLKQSGNFLNIDSFFSPFNYIKLRKILSSLSPDIIHIHNFIATLSPSILYSVRNYPTVMTLHDYRLVCFREKISSSGKVCKVDLRKCSTCNKNYQNLFKNLIIKKGLRNINYFIAPSNYIKEEYRKIYNIPIKTIYHPVLTSEYSEKNQGYLLYLGRLEKQKGITTLISAMKELKNIKLLIVGDGTQRKSLEEQTKGFANIEFLGWKEGEEKEKLIKSSLALVCPSIWPEVAGLSIYEAASYGKATIASSMGGIPEFIKDGYNGLLFHSGNVSELVDAILKVVDNQEKTKQMGLNAYQLSLEYNLEKHLEKIVNLYNFIKKK